MSPRLTPTTDQICNIKKQAKNLGVFYPTNSREMNQNGGCKKNNLNFILLPELRSRKYGKNILKSKVLTSSRSLLQNKYFEISTLSADV